LQFKKNNKVSLREAFKKIKGETWRKVPPSLFNLGTLNCYFFVTYLDYREYVRQFLFFFIAFYISSMGALQGGGQSIFQAGC
jgi:hypothetical protein